MRSGGLSFKFTISVEKVKLCPVGGSYTLRQHFIYPKTVVPSCNNDGVIVDPLSISNGSAADLWTWICQENLTRLSLRCARNVNPSDVDSPGALIPNTSHTCEVEIDDVRCWAEI